MIQETIRNITRNCFSTYNSRLIFTLISKNDFCTRNELAQWTGFSSITISRYLQEFTKQGLIGNAPGILFISELGKDILFLLRDLFEIELRIANSIIENTALENTLRSY